MIGIAGFVSRGEELAVETGDQCGETPFRRSLNRKATARTNAPGNLNIHRSMNEENARIDPGPYRRRESLHVLSVSYIINPFVLRTIIIFLGVFAEKQHDRKRGRPPPVRSVIYYIRSISAAARGFMVG